MKHYYTVRVLCGGRTKSFLLREPGSNALVTWIDRDRVDKAAAASMMIRATGWKYVVEEKVVQ